MTLLTGTRTLGVLYRTLAAAVVLAIPVDGAEMKDLGTFEILVTAPAEGGFADDLLQEAIDRTAARGGGIVTLGTGDFKLARKAGDETVVLKSGVTLRGQGYATHIYLDPTTPASAARYYPVRIGTANTPAHNVVVENLRYTGNNQRIGGGSVMGFNARLEGPTALHLSCENITIRHCWIYDAQQAAGCTKPAKGYADARRLDAQHKNWQVYKNYIDTCGNKAIEFAECNGGLIADNYITNVCDGPQVIFGSRNVQIRDNEVYFTRSGINISEGSNHIRVSGNHVEPMTAIDKRAAIACLYFRTEPLPNASVISDIVVTGNILCDPSAFAQGVVTFHTRPEATSCTYQAITFTGNVFDGNVLMHDTKSPQKTAICDIVFANNICAGDLASVPESVMSSSRILVQGNMLRKPGDYHLHANQWVWSTNTHAKGTLQVTTGAAANVVHGNVTTTPIVDKGRGTSVANNVVLASPINSVAHQEP